MTRDELVQGIKGFVQDHHQSFNDDGEWHKKEFTINDDYLVSVHIRRTVCIVDIDEVKVTPLPTDKEE